MNDVDVDGVALALDELMKVEVLELVEVMALLHVLLCHDFQALGGEHFSCEFLNVTFA